MEEFLRSNDLVYLSFVRHVLEEAGPAFAAELRNLAKKTRVRQSDYLREAVADLLAKYGHLPTEEDGSAH